MPSVSAESLQAASGRRRGFRWDGILFALAIAETCIVSRWSAIRPRNRRRGSPAVPERDGSWGGAATTATDRVMCMAYAFVGFGLILLIIGSEAVLRGGTGLSRNIGLSPLLIGLLVVSIGTGAPEMVVSLQATLRQAPDLALGTIIGSNIVNLLLVLGLGALIRPIPASPNMVLRDGGVLILSSVTLLALVEAGSVPRGGGLALLGGFAVYVVICFLTDWRRPPLDSGAQARALSSGDRAMTPAVNTILLLFGLACLNFGGSYVVDGSLAIARFNHVPEEVIGLTLVAVGSSLPELATTVTASIRGHSSLAAGNLIGSNIVNILLALGLAASVRPLTLSHQVAGMDIYVMTAAAVVVPLVMASRWRLSRGRGVFLVLAYLSYLGFLAWRQGLVPAGIL
ncbi:MAG: calcium/sodium antiporter [Alphaproteobacteria bacterium]|nr:calcium/sodium antiporter [Alphaproteobacteria bacterium]MDE2012519.1 calcium/sodium antiporter [Alphaproteobacteria bacterium]MDE2072817.1 calcium/sodium antiporter [Alphaproteobacteria bacterium]